MKQLFLILAMLLPVSGFADIFSVRVDAASTNIPASFADSSASRVLQGVRNMRGVLAFSTTTTAIVVNCSSSATVVPSDTSSHNFYVPGGGTGAIAIDAANLSGVCYIRSDGSAISSGKLYLMATGG